MNVFGFIKDVGANLFGKGKSEAEAVKELLVKEFPNDIEKLNVEFTDGIVKLSGDCTSQTVKEKVVLLAGNVKGVEGVNADDLNIPEPEKESTFYEIKRGDTLSRIAKEFYGNAMKYPAIFEANREVIKDADLIYPGQKIRIPEL